MTARARETKRLLDEGRVEEAARTVPEEREYPLPEHLRALLRMDETE